MEDKEVKVEETHEAQAASEGDASEAEAVEVEVELETEAAGSEREQELLAQIEALQKQVEENNTRYLRAQADLDNYRKRTTKEKQEAAKYASKRVVEELLPVMDNFERALSAGQGENADPASVVQGVQMIFGQIQQVLEQEGVKPIEAAGQPFDPNFHQAVMQVESDEHESNIVVEELQKGYMYKDRVIRPAMVKVSS